METIEKKPRKPRTVTKPYNVQRKITVRHYLNKSVKPIFIDNKGNGYPLYIQISLKGQMAMFKSRLSKHLTEGELKTMNNILKEAIEKDKSNLVKIAEMLQPFDRSEFKITEVSDLYFQYTKPIFEFLSEILAHVIGHHIESHIENEPSCDSNLLMALLRGINWEGEPAFYLRILNETCPELYSEIENMFKTVGFFDYIKNFYSLYVNKKYNSFQRLSYFDMESQSLPNSFFEHFGDSAQTFLKDIDTLVMLHKQYKSESFVQLEINNQDNEMDF